MCQIKILRLPVCLKYPKDQTTKTLGSIYPQSWVKGFNCALGGEIFYGRSGRRRTTLPNTLVKEN